MLTSNAIGNVQGTPAGSVREYRVGDALRQIHWKQSARQGQLLVNQYEREQSHDRTLLLVTNQDAYRSYQEFETVVSATATIAITWLGGGRSVTIDEGTGQVPECKSASQVLRLLALVKTNSKPTTVSRAVDGVITGAVLPELEMRLKSRSFHGVLWSTRRSVTSDSWHHAEIVRDKDWPTGAMGSGNA